MIKIPSNQLKRKILNALIGEMCLKSYYINNEREASGSVCVPAKTEAAAVRMARRYLNVQGDIFVWTKEMYDTQIYHSSGIRIEPPHYYTLEDF